MIEFLVKERRLNYSHHYNIGKNKQVSQRKVLEAPKLLLEDKRLEYNAHCEHDYCPHLYGLPSVVVHYRVCICGERGQGEVN